jgi:dTDP-glucose pyrophosphorylase
MREWQKLVVPPSSSILAAMQVIDNGGVQLVLVADEAGRLLGTVTDGDVRRGILKQIPLSAPVSEIMNSSPRTVAAELGRSELLHLMRHERLHCVPRIDSNKHILGLTSIDEIALPEPRENWVVLMAGGRGDRLRPLTDTMPKPLLSIGGRPILETTIRNLVSQGFWRFFISVNYLGDMIETYFGDGTKYGCQITYLREEAFLGTGGALSLLPSRPSQPLLLLNGDVLTNMDSCDLLAFHNARSAGATMVIRKHEYQVPYGVVRFDKYYFNEISEKPVSTYFVNAGIYCLSPDVLDLLEANGPIDMPDLLVKARNRGITVTVYPLVDYWLDIGRVEDLRRAHFEFQTVFE